MSETPYENPTPQQGPDDSSTSEPATVAIEASLEAPEIETQQAAFIAENPDAFILTVEYCNGVIRDLVTKLSNAAPKIPSGMGSFKTEALVVEKDGVTLRLSVDVAGAYNPVYYGMATFAALNNQMVVLMSDLIDDPIGERRREYLQMLTELEVSAETLERLKRAALVQLRHEVDMYRSQTAVLQMLSAQTAKNTAAEPTTTEKVGVWTALKQFFGLYAED